MSDEASRPESCVKVARPAPSHRERLPTLELAEAAHLLGRVGVAVLEEIATLERALARFVAGSAEAKRLMAPGVWPQWPCVPHAGAPGRQEGWCSHPR
jgi:hypothetical protein